jgi:D-3-phosphoglycerate dehydrogenase / 2-oxoglutarate reductase
MKPTILVAESSSFSSEAVRFLEDTGNVVLADLDRRSLLSSVTDVDILWVRLRNRIDLQIFQAARRLRVIATPTTGLNHIDVAEAERRNIHIISLRGEAEFLQNIFATAEHTIALILGLLRHLPAAHQHVINGRWNRDLFVGRELHGKTAGVIGYGRVGRMVAGYLRTFGMRVLATDLPSRMGHQCDDGIESVPLDELLKNSDLVTLHIPLVEGTTGFLGECEFSKMKRGVCFINTSRGELVDETALLVALDNGTVGCAAFDVLTDESSSGMMDNPIVQYSLSHKNVLITPHIAGCTVESRAKTEVFLATRVAAFVRDQNDLPCTQAAHSSGHL